MDEKQEIKRKLQEINELVESLIRIRDDHRDTLNRKELDDIADACNLIYHNRNMLAKKEN